MKKVLIGLGVVLGLVVVAGVAAFFLINPQKLVSEKKDALLKDVSAQIGREVTAGDVQASVGGTLWARINKIRVGPPKDAPLDSKTPDKKAQLEIGSVDMRFSLVRALLSFGSDLYVEQFTVNSLVIRAARDAEGKWDFQDILDKTATPPEEAKPDEKPSGKNPLEGARIASVKIENARVELDDAMLGRPLAVGQLNIGVSDIVLGDPLAVKIAAVLEDGAKKSPVDVDVKLAVLPKDLAFDPMPNVEVKAKVNDLDLGPWGGLAPGDVPAPVAGSLKADIKLDAKDNVATLAVDGTVNVKGLVLRDKVGATATAAERNAAPRGQPLDADVAVKLTKSAAGLQVDSATFTGSGVDVKASLEAKGESAANLEKADVDAKVADLGRVLAVLPPSLRGLPEAVVIQGPLAAKVGMNGAELTGNVSLDSAVVKFLDLKEGEAVTPETKALFDKSAGKPLNLTLHGKKGATALDIDTFALVLDTAKIGGSLSIPTDDKSPLNADINSGAIQLASLQGLVPPFKEAIGRGQKVDGTVELKVKATSAAGKQQADASVNLSALDVNLEGTMVRGSGNIALKAVPAGEEVSISVQANLDGISATKKGEDGALVLNKTSGLPLRLDVDAKQQKTRVDIPKIALVIGKSTINGKGAVTALDQKTPQLDVDLGNVSLGFDDLRAAVPGAAKLPAGGTLKANVKLAGGASADAMDVVVKGLDIAFGASKVKGDVTVKKVGAPVLDVNLTTVDLAFNDLRPLSEGTRDLPAGGQFVGTLKMTGDTAKTASVATNVKIDRLYLPTDKKPSTIKGTIDLKNLDKPSFTLALDADHLDVDALTTTFGGKDDGKGGKDAKAKKDANPHGLSKETRELLADVNGRGTITAGTAIVSDMDMQKFKGTLVMTRGKARFETLEFDFYGGHMSASGTNFDLAAGWTGYDIDMEGKNVDVGAFMADQANVKGAVKGTVSPKIRVKGKGLAAGDFASTAEGPAELTFRELTFDALDLLGPVGDALGKAKNVPGMKFSAVNTKGTKFQPFTALTKLIGGKMKLEKPVETQTNAGKMKLDGAAGLMSGPDFTGTLDLPPETVQKMTGDKVKVKKAVPVPMKIGGTWDKPVVTGVDVGPLAKAIIEALGGKAVEDAVDTVSKGGKDAAEDAVGDVLGGGDKKDKKDKDGKKKAEKEGKKKAKEGADKAKDAAKGLFGK